MESGTRDRLATRLGLAVMVGVAFPVVGLAVADDVAPVTTTITVERQVRADPKPAGDEAFDRIVGQVVEQLVPKRAEARKQAIRVGRLAMPARVIAVAPAGAPAVDLDPIIQQFSQQFRPLVQAELALLGTACDPSPEQRRALGRAGEDAVKAAARACAEAQQGMNNGRPFNQNAAPDPRKIIQDRLTEAVAAHLPADRADRWRAEVRSRDDDRKRGTVVNLVAVLDRDLVLSADQREKLVRAMMANWDDAWNQSLEMLQYGSQFFPKVPDALIGDILTQTQREAWNAMPKNQSIFFGIGFVGNGVMVDADALAEEFRVEPKAGDGEGKAK